jgi:hypothetical protein
MEKVNVRDPQDLRNLLYMREPLRKFVQKISWKKGEAVWKTILDEQGREQGHEMVGAEELDEARWDLTKTLANTDDDETTSIDTEQMLAVAIESLVKLINFALNGEKIDATGADLFLAKFDVSSHPVHSDRKKQLAAMRILDLTIAMALLPGEWVLNEQINTINTYKSGRSDPASGAAAAGKTVGTFGSFIVLQLQRASQLAHCLAKLIIFNNMEAAEYVYTSQVVLPLIRQLNGGAQVDEIEETKAHELTDEGVQKTGTAVWDFRTMSQEAAASIQVVMQGNMIDNFGQEILAKNFAQINSKTEVKTTIAKYQFLAAGLRQGAAVKKQQRWILKEVLKLSNQYFLPIPGQSTFGAEGADSSCGLHLPKIDEGRFGTFSGNINLKFTGLTQNLGQL